MTFIVEIVSVINEMHLQPGC